MILKRKLLFLLILCDPSLSATSLEDAYVREQIQSRKEVWQVGNSKIQTELTYVGNRLLLTKLFNPQTGTDWTPPRDQASLSQWVYLRFRDREYRFQVPDGPIGDRALLRFRRAPTCDGSRN